MAPTDHQPMSKPASAESGYIFSMPKTEVSLNADPFLRRLLSWYLPEDVLARAEPEIAQIATQSGSDQVKQWLSDASQREPYVKTHDVWGARYDVDKLVTSEGWKQLRSWGARNGIVATGYEPEYGSYRRIVQHAKNYFFTPTSAVTSCPLSMSDGAAQLLSQFLPDLAPSHPFHEVYRRLTSRHDYWTSGQWMTERPGGSDVQNSETWATYSPLANKSGTHGRLDQGDYLVSGFKFFSSATDADITVLLAKTESGKLSAFIAPLQTTIVDPETSKERTVTNGVRIHRLKTKLGTKQLPTAELELRQMRAHLVGPLGRGVPTISHILNVTRSHAFIGSSAGWRRCLSLAKTFAKGRKVFGQPLWTLPLHLRTLAETELKLRGALHLAFFTVALVSFTENGHPPQRDKSSGLVPLPLAGPETEVVLRVLTATTKAAVNKNAVMGIQECMEAMGGVGYMDEPDEPENIARALRDMNVNTIWEGTTNVLGSDVVRQLLKNNHLELINSWLNRSIDSLQDTNLSSIVSSSWQNLHRRLEQLKDGDGGILAALSDGRRLMFSLAWICEALLLALNAERDGEPLAVELARRWILDGEGGVGEWRLPGVGGASSKCRSYNPAERAAWDCLLVFDEALPGMQKPRQSKM